MHIPKYHTELSALHIGVEAPRAYYIPYHDKKSALTLPREDSQNFTLLSGEWKFKFFSNFDDIPESVFSAEYDTKDSDDITVPKCWQLYTDRGYDKITYANLEYPFTVDPPYLPDEIPCGVYFKDVEIKKDGKKLYLVFEGVAPCFYLYINGRFCAYSQVSHSTSEIDITDFAVDGSNRITVVVTKWCDGSYLEDQDFFRLSGIFRDVYILKRAEGHIKDIKVDCRLDDSLTNCTVSVETQSSANGSYTFINADGEEIRKGSFSGNFSFEVTDPILWNAENPYLYTLLIESEGEYIPIKTGIKKVEIKDKKFLINGKREILRGVNRHDSNPHTGYAVSVEDMRNDLYLMKRANINTIRTSHYPNDPRFYEMCSELGFYTVDEADLETHGMGYNTKEDWDWTRWSYLSSSPEWKDAYVDRAARLFERDKNSPCVIMWSLGNESGAGVNHRAMAKYIKSRRADAVVHYENSHKEFKAVPEGEDFSDISDVESRMYASAEYIEDYLKDESNQKPFYMCEYVSASSTGEVYKFFDLVDKYENFSGGCVWEFCDHIVTIPCKDGKERSYARRDCEYINSTELGAPGGVVYGNRKPRPGYYDLKKVYEPFSGAYLGGGKVLINNKRRFASLDDLYIDWCVCSNGKAVISGKTDRVDIAPCQSKEIKLFESEDFSALPNCFLTLSFKLADNRPWAEKGYETGFLQFELGTALSESGEIHEESDVTANEDKRYINVKFGKNEMTFDKALGCICSLKGGGKQLIKENIAFDIFRAESGGNRAWELERFDVIKQKTYSAKLVSSDSNSAVIETEASLGAHSRPPVIRMKTVWTVNSKSGISVKCSVNVRENAPSLPRFGLNIVMPAEFNNVRYFALGERESYPDKVKAWKHGLYETTADEMYEHYTVTMECSNREKTRWAQIFSSDGAGIEISGTEGKEVSFKAIPYSAHDLMTYKRDFELPDSDSTYVSLDYKVAPITAERKELEFSEKSFECEFLIRPFVK